MLNLILIIESILEILLLLLFLFRKNKILKNKIFLFYILGIVGWVLRIALFGLTSDPSLGRVWGIMYYISAALIATTLFQFSYLFPYREKQGRSKPLRFRRFAL